MAERKIISFQERYQTGQTPWELNRVDSNLVTMISQAGIKPCKVLDIGCGTGDNAIWMAQNGFEVTGCDGSELAIARAIEKSAIAGVECIFYQADFLLKKSMAPMYSLLFDRGCYHCFSEDDQRHQFVKNCHSFLKPDGLWISLMGNADEERQEQGPPQMSCAEIAAHVEPFFEILLLESGIFDSSLSTPPRAWLGLFRKRNLA